jgi:hypothetical protein
MSSTTKGEPVIQQLWRAQRFTRCKKPVSLNQLQKYATYAGSKVTELAIDDCRNFGLNAYYLKRIVFSAEHLKVLKLQAPEGVDKSVFQHTMNSCLPQLTGLHLYGIDVSSCRQFLHGLVRASAETLQDLTIMGVGDFKFDALVVFSANWPVLKHLRTLRIGNRAGGDVEMVSKSHMYVRIMYSQEVVIFYADFS